MFVLLAWIMTRKVRTRNIRNTLWVDVHDSTRINWCIFTSGSRHLSFSNAKVCEAYEV